MRAFICRYAGANRWLQRGVMFAAGAMGALALPPYSFFPALCVAMTVGVWAIDAATLSHGWHVKVRAAGASGWWFGFGYFVAGLWWLGAAFLVEAEQFAWALPLGVLGLPAVLALFPAAGFALAAALWRSGPQRVLIFAGALGLSEFLRGTLFTGFPWNAYGMALGDHLWTAQIASILGLYGLTTLTVALAAAPATLVCPPGAQQPGGRIARLLPTAIAAAVLAGVAAYGFARIPQGPAPSEAGVKLRIVQPSITQDTTVFNWDNRERILNQYVRLTQGLPGASLQTAKVTHVVWPESAFPFLLADTPEALRTIGDMLPDSAVLVTGAARAEAKAPGGRPSVFYNSMQVVDHHGRVVSAYDKSHLVPFGEYMPFASLLDRIGVRQFVQIPGGFTPGEAGGDLKAPGLPHVSPLICYEAIFPGFGPARGPSGVILNVTNDGWFGNTPGPWQHFAQARLRAIETGLPLVRAANTGISAVVDPWGRIVSKLTLGETGYIDSPLPSAISPTTYAQKGNLVFALLLIFCFSWCVLPPGAGTAPRRLDVGP